MSAAVAAALNDLILMCHAIAYVCTTMTAVSSPLIKC